MEEQSLSAYDTQEHSYVHVDKKDLKFIDNSTINGMKFKIYKHIPSSHMLYIKGESSIPLLGGSNKNESKIPSFGNVVPLTNFALQNINKDNAVWLEKTDGLRKNLQIENGEMIDLKTNEKIFINGFDDIKRTIIDAELYDDKYYIFDVAEVNGEDISSLPFPKRIDAIKPYLNNQDLIQSKPYYPIDSIESLVEIADSLKSPSGMDIDGVIIQRIDLPFEVKDSVFKLKKSILNTVDLLYNKSTVNMIYNLFCCGTKHIKPCGCKCDNDFLRNRCGVKLEGVELIPPINPFICGIATCNVANMELIKNSGLPQAMISSSIELLDKLSSDPNYLDKKVIESAIIDGKVIPIRERIDKIYPNSYNTVMSNLGLMFDKLNVNQIFFHRSKSHFSKELINNFHSENQRIRSEAFKIIKSYIKSTNPNVVDLCGGRGADLPNLAELRPNIVAVDADSSALVRYATRTFPGKSLIKSMSVLKEVINDGQSKIAHEIKSRFSCNGQSSIIHLILINFAFHHIANSIGLSKLLRNIANKNTIIAILDYDLESEIISGNLAINKKLNLGSFTIELTSRNPLMAKMPYPTIDSSGYREEPLLTRKMFSDNGLTILATYKFKSDDNEIGGYVSHICLFICAMDTYMTF